MKILITGGCGFIGSNAVKYFANKYGKGNIVVIDKCTYAADPKRVLSLGVPLYRLDVATLQWEYVLDLCRPDVLIHYAADTHVDNSIIGAEEFIHSNILGTYKLIQGFRKYSARFPDAKKPLVIIISTDEVYGDLPVDTTRAFDETWPLNPNNPYSASKAAADLLVQACSHTYNDFNWVICRSVNNYGLNQHDEKLLPTVIRSILDNKPVPIYGKGENIREWLWAEDFVHGVDRIVESYDLSSYDASFLPKVNKQIFNFGSDGQVLNNLAIVKLVLHKMLASESLISFVPDRLGHDRRYCVNWAKTNNILGWKPMMPFEDGVQRVILDIKTRRLSNGSKNKNNST